MTNPHLPHLFPVNPISLIFHMPNYNANNTNIHNKSLYHHECYQIAS